MNFYTTAQCKYVPIKFRIKKMKLISTAHKIFIEENVFLCNKLLVAMICLKVIFINTKINKKIFNAICRL